MLAFKYIIICIVATVDLSQNVPTVSNAVGTITGYYQISEAGNKYEAYEGIRYALPPTGNRRFEPPVPISSWEGNLNSIKTGNKCVQLLHNLTHSWVEGDEDCLFLNIYKPIKRDNFALPVIVMIHGGDFQYSSGNDVGAKYLMDRRIIYVSFDYRLGSIGFLSTEDEVVPGNMGLKDQSAALQWIKRNIKYFNGDPNRITIVGVSAGAASVHYHYLSPMSAGLFRSGISISGNALKCSSQTKNSREKALQLAEIVNCTNTNIKEMVACLKNKPAKTLVAAQINFMPWNRLPYTPFGPVVERSSKEPFINRPPIKIINSGDVQDLPWITGLVSEEGLYAVAPFALKENILKDLNDNWETITPLLLDYNFTLPNNKRTEVAKRIRKHYFGSNSINKETLSNLIHAVGDRLYAASAVKAAKAQAKVNRNPVFFYYYTFRASESLSNILANTTENLGVCHADDILMVLNNTFVGPKTSRDFAMQKDLIDLWITVAYKGVPGLRTNWPKVGSTKAGFEYLQFNGPSNFVFKTNDSLGQSQFWDSIPFNENIE